MRYLKFLLIVSLFYSCHQQQALFVQVTADQSGIHFSNQINESDELNILNYEYLYNGGGVGIGDFNNDSLPDIFFTGNTVSNKLYINKGNLKFEDVTEEAGISGNGKWGKGVSIIDINNDGLMDIYASCAVLNSAEKRKNLLYVNQGNDKNGKPVFKDEANSYGLDDNSSTQMAAFFDYDNDGDLDVYLLINDLDGTYPNEFRPIRKDGSWPNTDKLLRNDWNDTLKHPVFTDVSKQAGILIEGHGLGVNICDINNDGWKDIYVSNDYISNNILYINNHDGTFTDHCSDYFKHTSKNAMGNDVSDINNDGLPDVIELDMMPEDNYRQKMMYNDIKYETWQNSATFGYMHQYVRNCLQLNQGPSIGNNDSIRSPVFSEVGYFAGISQTDWSWAPLSVDIDNDGYRDIMISNGLPKDMSDLDFMSYRSMAAANTPPTEMLKQLPTVFINNYIFHNNGDITFTDKTKEWGWNFPTYSAGMAYADFDLDGDMDVVINNTDMEATLLKNTLNDNKTGNNHYLNIKLKGNKENINAIGATINIYYQGKQQYFECTPYRGYLSSIENTAHFGLGAVSLVDSIIVKWPNAKKQTLKNISVDKTVFADIKDANDTLNYELPGIATGNLFTDITQNAAIDFRYNEEDFIDFDIQRMIPHKLTQYGPSLAVADINGDGLQDFVAGGGSPKPAAIFYQTADGKFIIKKLFDPKGFKYQDDGGICLFDADNDGDADMYIASGGCENGPVYVAYQDHFYLNDGRGSFKEDSLALDRNYATKSCVKAADYDGDGDLDLFIGGRVLPGSYPQAVSSFIYRNDTKDGKIKFTDVTSKVAAALQNIGMVCDGTWSDFDNDGDADLIVAGEWMAINFLRNDNGKFTLIKTSLDNEKGWWNSISAADIDNDGDMDYVLGNCGNNGYLHPSPQYPMHGYGKDFDNNGTYDAVFTSWQRTSLKDTSVKEYLISGRDDFIREMSFMKQKFPTYASYANATISDVFSAEQIKEADIYSVNNFNTCWIENKGNMQFVLHTLPAQAQWAPVYGIALSDFNGDGNIDIALNANEYSMLPMLGRYDAMNGLVLQGDGKGNFNPLSILQSGFYVPGNGKSLGSIIVKGKPAMIAGQNTGPLKLFADKNFEGKVIAINPDDVFAIINLTNGKKRKEEFFYGSSFMSQSGRYIVMDASVKSVIIMNNKKQQREILN